MIRPEYNTKRATQIVLTFVVAFCLLSPLATRADKIKVIIDTDLAMGYKGHDVDDGLALLIALNSPELEILGVTTSWGNHDQEHTHHKAIEILNRVGRDDIPVLRGSYGYYDLGEETDASRFIAETVMDHPGEVTLLVIGTQTNIATAMINHPEITPRIKQVVAMGGTLAPPGKWPYWAVLDLNFGANVKAARYVLESGVPFHMAHSALCIETVITPEHYKRMIEQAPYQRDLLLEQTAYWFKLRFFVGPAPGIEGVVPWDVTALAYLLHPEWFEDNWRRGEIDNKGWGYKTVRVYESNLTPGYGDFNAPSALHDKDAFWEWFHSRI